MKLLAVPKWLSKAALSVVLLWAGAGCQEETVVTPKPRTYPRITYPEKAYRPFDTAFCALRFEYPAYAVVQQDTNYFDQKPIHPCWFDVVFPSFNGRLHCSYYEINKTNTFDKLRSDAFELTDKHNIRATYIDQQPIERGNVKGYLFMVDGPVATPIQFYVSDSTRHFFRGSLYFNNKIDIDSMAPVYAFIKKDIEHLLSTFAWKR